MKFGLREIVFIVLLMVIPVGAWWFVFRPQNARNAQMRAQIEARQAKLQQLNETLNVVGDIEEQIKLLGDAVEYFQSKLPEAKEIDKILKEISQLAESSKLRAKKISTEKRRSRQAGFLAEGSHHAEQPIVIELEGDFKGFYAFLLALENQPRIMRISTMDLKTLSNGEPGQISAEFEMSIFFEQNGKERLWSKKKST